MRFLTIFILGVNVFYIYGLKGALDTTMHVGLQFPVMRAVSASSSEM